MIIKAIHREEIFLLRSGKIDKKETECEVGIKLPDIKFANSTSEKESSQREPLTSLSLGPSREEALRELKLAIKNYIPMKLKISLHTFRSERIKIRFWTMTFLDPPGSEDTISKEKIRTFRNYPGAFPILRTGSSLFLASLLNSEVVKISSTSLLDVKDGTETLIGGDVVFIMLEEIAEHQEILSGRFFPWALNLKAKSMFPAHQKDRHLFRNGYPYLKEHFPHSGDEAFSSLEELTKFFREASIRTGFYLEARSGTTAMKPKLSVKGIKSLNATRDGFVVDFLWSSYEGINSGPIKLFIPYEELKLAGITRESEYFYDEEKLRFFKIPSFVVRAYGVRK